MPLIIAHGSVIPYSYKVIIFNIVSIILLKADNAFKKQFESQFIC